MTSPDHVDPSLADLARGVLGTAEPAAKVELTRQAVQAWRSGAVSCIGEAGAPPRPARPAQPVLLHPSKMPARSPGAGVKGRIALLHAVAHIELNAIDLAWDLIARFAQPALPRAFFDDWVRVAGEEATHHALVVQRLHALGAVYGDLPAHDGLWEAAAATSEDLLARLAVVPLVLEARGLDVTPAMIGKLRAAGDAASVEALEVIYRDEVGHVAIGHRWFTWVCGERGLEPAATWRDRVARGFKGRLKPPFNEAARRQAGFEPDWYGAVAAPSGAAGRAADGPRG